MCGIVGYAGSRAATPILVEGLRRLEYRGYDSAGIAIQNGSGIEIRKIAGRVQALDEVVQGAPVIGTSGIAHTRWATHGAPNDTNAHPHRDCSGKYAVVHNGIIENYDSIRSLLMKEGHSIITDTDTEVLAHLVERSTAPTLEGKVLDALRHVEGTYGMVVMSADDPGRLVVARKGSPVILGVGDGEFFVASDASALLEHTRQVVYLDDGDIVTLDREGYRVFDRDAQELSRPVSSLDWDIEAIELGGHAHFMSKEIYEQPETVKRTLRGRLLFEDGIARLNGLNLDDAAIAEIKRIRIVACGTSWHSGLVGRYVIEQLAGIPVDVEYASEFRYHRQLPGDGVVTIAISQSGETADTLEALREAKSQGGKVLGLVNVVGSTIARESDGGVYLHAGPEIGVASTKAFTSQIVALTMIGVMLGRRRGLGLEEGREFVYQLARLPELIEDCLSMASDIESIAQHYVDASNFLYLGRGVSFPVALEGALKLKEISYIHAEGYPAAEMKHGPIALIDDKMPVVIVAPEDRLYNKVLANMQEVKARGGRTIVVTSADGADVPGADHVIRVPSTPELLSPVVCSIPLQLLAYHIAVLRGCDVDKPRNLAKSVTVE